MRVQGWLHTSLWPLQEALPRALQHLEEGNLTWRAGTGRMEGVRDAPAYLTAAGRANLHDLIAVEDGELGRLLEEQAAALIALGRAAAAAHAAWIDALRAASGRFGGAGRRAVEEQVDALAEALVNGVMEIHIAGGDALAAGLRQELDALRRGPVRAGLDAARAAAVAATRALQAEVADEQRRLCDRYDLPPAPVVVHTLQTHH